MAVSRVQFAKNFTHNATVSGTTAPSPTLTTPATAGNALLILLTIDKASGAITTPAGWTLIAAQTGVQSSIAVFGMVAAGGETAGPTVSWATASFGYAYVLAEYSGVSASPFGPSQIPAYSDTAVTSIVLDPPAATAPGLGLAVLTMDTANDATGFQPAAAGFTLVDSIYSTTSGTGQPGLAFLETSSPVTSGQDIAATTFTWTRSDQVQGAVFFLNASGGGPTPPVVGAGADATATTGVTFTRTATESDGGATITSRAWTIVSGPSGAGTTIGTAAALSWTPTTAGTYVLRYSATNSAGTGSDDATVTASDPAAVTPTLVHRVVGVPDGTTGRVAVRTTNAASVRLKVGTNTAVTAGVVFGPTATPDAQGNSQLTVTGLTAGTRYYYRVAMTPSGGGESLDTAATVGTFKTAPTGPASFAFNFGSCTNAADSASMAAIAARGDDLFLHLGDLYYGDGTGTGIANFRSKMAAKVQAANHQSVFSTTPTVYTPSDHDGMNNNGAAGSDATAWTNWNQAFRELFSTPTLPGSTGCYYTFTWGRVRFIVLDDRSFKSAPSATDNASKTALGATQKQWLKDTITGSAERVIVLAQSSPWIGPAVAGDDGWAGYTTERTELASFFAASGKNIVMLAGDMHALAADDGTNAPGGITVLHAAPFNQNGSQKGGPYTAGPYPTTGSVVEQYGRVVVTDSGSSISLAFTGYSSDNTARVSLTKTYNVAAPVAPSQALLPFDPTSPWRLGIATAATFAAVGDARNTAMSAVDAAGQGWLNYSQYSHPIASASGADPLATVTDSFHATTDIPAGGSWTERIPATARIAAGTDKHMHVITPDGLSVQEHFGTTKASDTSYTTTRRHQVSLSGAGTGPQNGTRAYGGSAIGGLIRAWEIDPAHPDYTGEIRHALAVALRHDQLYYSGTTLPDDGHGGTYLGTGYAREQGYVWPATEQDAGSSGSYTGTIPMGSYFAIPPDVDLTTLGLATPQALMVAHACQDYGVYVTDGSGASAFYLEDDGGAATSAFNTALLHGPTWDAPDVKKLFTALRVVTSNSGSTPNGGALGATRRGVAATVPTTLDKLRLGAGTVGLYLGTAPVDKAHIGATQVWP